MKKCSLYELITLTLIFSLSFFTSCSSDKVAGTSEDTNEFAYRVSSSSEEELSSSGKMSSSSWGNAHLGIESSSSVKSSSSRVVSSCSSAGSSSTRTISSSSHAISSSSNAESSNSSQLESSSSLDSVNEGSASPKTLEDYLKLLNIASDLVVVEMLSVKFDFNDNVNLEPENPVPPGVTEFDSPWPLKIVKQNLYGLEEFFPMAYKHFPEIIDAIKNETLDENCGLYMLNVYADGFSRGYVVSGIAKDTIKVLDVPAGNCKAIPPTEKARFLFYYCGEISSHADVVHVPVEMNLSQKCSALKSNEEWVNIKSPVQAK
ncbi:hypothetical protein [Fibrobacter sp. UBA4297]|uniref:hypothetical protein n=1 Tax=Fibrobacter sp. UBA4297 TaxID=1946536 RepID=UPI0025C10900|nr:hypothetical protein [Fibrobacter sp. UBA4297]